MGWRDPSRVGQPLRMAPPRPGEALHTPSETQSDASPTDLAMAEHLIELAMGSQTPETTSTRPYTHSFKPNPKREQAPQTRAQTAPSMKSPSKPP